VLNALIWANCYLNEARYRGYTIIFSLLMLSLFCSQGLAGQGGRLPAPVTDSDFYDDGNPDPALVELGKNLFSTRYSVVT